MDELVKAIDKSLDYISHEIDGDTLWIHVASNRTEAVCPVCGHTSARVHSRYERTLSDLPSGEYKVNLVLHRRKMFCDNPECSRTTFAEPFDFFGHKEKRTNRLWDRIMRTAVNMSSVSASKVLKDGVCDVHFTSICSRLKKKRQSRK